jgi:hypothetical protein
VNKLEKLANEIAFLNNRDIMQLSDFLVRDYPTRADVLETGISVCFQNLQPTKQDKAVNTKDYLSGYFKGD